jgi:uncharacterized membrane protein
VALVVVAYSFVVTVLGITLPTLLHALHQARAVVAGSMVIVLGAGAASRVVGPTAEGVGSPVLIALLAVVAVVALMRRTDHEGSDALRGD